MSPIFEPITRKSVKISKFLSHHAMLLYTAQCTVHHGVELFLKKNSYICILPNCIFTQAFLTASFNQGPYLPSLLNSRTVASGGLYHPQFLSKQLTLSQPEGQIMPTTVIQAPRIFRPCDAGAQRGEG